jgi:polysaccharide biosynthesis/export protein VpsN
MSTKKKTQPPSSSFRAALFRLLTVLCVVTAAWGAGCSSDVDNRHLNLAAPTESGSVGPGDVFKMQIVGEKDLPDEYQVASDGTVDLPYIQQLKVAGLEPQEIARLIRKELIQRKILVDPAVVVSVKEYASKKISILGQVQKPGSFPYAQGMTLIQAISQAGGLSGLANKDRVNLTRRNKTGSRTVVLSVDAITEGRSPDIPLQAGDQIYVHERIF